MSDRERAEAANAMRATILSPPAPSPPGAPAGAALAVAPPRTDTVFCAWTLPIKDSKSGEWVSIRNGCFAPPVSAATASCTQQARSENPAVKPCDCTDDKAVAAKCQR